MTQPHNHPAQDHAGVSPFGAPPPAAVPEGALPKLSKAGSSRSLGGAGGGGTSSFRSLLSMSYGDLQGCVCACGGLAECHPFRPVAVVGRAWREGGGAVGVGNTGF